MMNTFRGLTRAGPSAKQSTWWAGCVYVKACVREGNCSWRDLGRAYILEGKRSHLLPSPRHSHLGRWAMSSPEAQQRTSLDGHGIFAIIVFAVVALICIQPLSIPVPHRVSQAAVRAKHRLVGPASTRPTEQEQEQKQDQPHMVTEPSRKYVTLNHVWTPAIGILFLLASKTIGGEQIKVGIVGEEGVEPYDVLALFISLAYIAISLDATGLLRYLAFQVCLKAGSNGYGLYLTLYAFFWFLGVLVGNDPVILSGTAFLVHLTRVAGISPPSAWIWAQFVAANISSAVLVSSNPTNLVIATGFNITFPIYTAYMILPSLVSALVSLGVLLLFFRNRTKPKRAASGRGTLGLHTVQSWAKALSIKRPGLHSRASQRKKRPVSDSDGIAMSSMPAEAATGETVEEADDDRRTPLVFIPPTIIRPDVDARAALVDPKGAIFASCVMAATLITLVVTSVFGGVKVYMVAAPGAGICLFRDIAYDWYTWRSVRKAKTVRADSEHRSVGQEGEGTKVSAAMPEKTPLLAPLVSTVNQLADMFPTVTYVMARLPFPLLPFAFGMFILVQSLSHVGFITIMANGIGQVCSSGPAGCALFISALGVILCNVSEAMARRSTSAALLRSIRPKAGRYKHWGDDSTDKGGPVAGLPIPPRSLASGAHHENGLLFHRLWIQCGRTRRHICRQPCRLALA